MTSAIASAQNQIRRELEAASKKIQSAIRHSAEVLRRESFKGQLRVFGLRLIKRNEKNISQERAGGSGRKLKANSSKWTAWKKAHGFSGKRGTFTGAMRQAIKSRKGLMLEFKQLTWEPFAVFGPNLSGYKGVKVRKYAGGYNKTKAQGQLIGIQQRDLNMLRRLVRHHSQGILRKAIKQRLAQT